MSSLGFGCALVLAAVFVWAAAAKVARPDRTAAGFAAFGLPGARALAWVVPAAELLTAFWLVALPRAGGVVALGLLAVFTGVIVAALRRGVSAGCSCFGSVSTKPVSSRDILRNVVLMALAGAAMFAR